VLCAAFIQKQIIVTQIQ